jgi:DNA-binding transcriptional MerR regulator
MTPSNDRTYGTAAFAALAGITPRALRYYDRLGLLKPKRSRSGYRLYSERDLETLEEIVALKFIGVPLKEIPAIRRRAKGPFAQVLHAQRETLETRRRNLTRAISAIAAAETALRSGTTLDTQLIRQIIEVMHMDTQHEETINTYIERLKARASHMAAMSAEDLATLRQQWSTLVDDVKAAFDEDPAGPRAQHLLDRWESFLGTLTGTGSETAAATGDARVAAQPELRGKLWARRAEWLPADAARESVGVQTADEAVARLREQVHTFAERGVLNFIQRARAARR